ncbi:MAG TPA: homoserine dehydrogenase [Spirochaetota bacterium]|nr:homoserine dehydrogenase [Spirochaetota bacterium]
MDTVVNIGLVGFGTVGNGVYQLLRENHDIILQKTGIDLRLKTICDIRADEIRDSITGVTVTSDWKDITGDREIDIVVELIGGIEPAKSILLEALNCGKNIVTANKKLLAEEGTEIFETAQRLRGKIGFEAAVGGGIPCIQALKSGLVGNRIESINGILNGTTNYILTMMEECDLSFSEALKDAQEKGFAEADPTFDVEGYDAAHKIAIISMLAFNRKIDYDKIGKEGITGISSVDISYAQEMGYVIKLLGISKLVDDEIDIRVHPTMIHGTHPLAAVRNEFNAIMYIGDMTGPVTLTGKGAGSRPTASAVVSDIVQIIQSIQNIEGYPVITETAKYLPADKRLSRYYLRVHTLDVPGILSKISGVLGDYKISIASVIQQEMDSDYVPLIIMTYEAYEHDILAALDEIKAFDFVEKVIFIRVEDSIDLGDKHE